MGTRKQCRESLVTAFAGQGFTSVLGYAPVDLQGASKVLCIYSDRTRHDMISQHLNNDFYSFFLEVYIKRSGGEDAEDNLDDMHDVIRSVVRANVGGSNWDHLDLNQESDAFFAEVAGVPYRVERHSLTAKAQS